jgi:alpha-galactosidase
VGLADGAGRGLAAVAAAATRASFRSRYDGERWELLCCEPQANGAGRPLWAARSGERFSADPISLSADKQVWSALTQGAKLRTSAQAGQVPQGWLSWYHYGPWVTQHDVLENSERLRAPDMAGLGYRLVQVDDGWQRAYGDWTPNAKFPDGFAVLAERLESEGQALGVWTAPFLVAADSALADTAPADWFLTDEASGDRLVDNRHILMGPMNVLDLRRPAVRRHLRDTFARLRAEGIGYFKIDFLYAGAYAGTRALRAGIRAIRDGVGDAYLLACGAPLLPMAGLVDGCRVGPDTATPFYNFELGSCQPTIFGDEVAAVARDLASRLHLAPWYQLDADVALVGGNLSLEQGRQLVTLAVLSGGPFFAGDNLPGLPPERLALLTNPEVMRLVGGGAAVPDWETGHEDLPPTTWRRGKVIAVFNWSAVARQVDVTVPGGCSVRDLWANRELGFWDGGGQVQVEAGSVCLLHVSG